MGFFDNVTSFFTGKKTEPTAAPIPAAPSAPIGLSSTTDTGINMGGRRRKHRKTKKAGRRHRKTRYHRKH